MKPPAFCGNRWFITAFTRAFHLSLSLARSIQCRPPPPAHTHWGFCDHFLTCLSFYGEELLAFRPTAKLEDHFLSAVRDTYWVYSELPNLRTRRGVMKETHLSCGRLVCYSVFTFQVGKFLNVLRLNLLWWIYAKGYANLMLILSGVLGLETLLLHTAKMNFELILRQWCRITEYSNLHSNGQNSRYRSPQKRCSQRKYSVHLYWSLRYTFLV
jgi:hypothetical protein